MFKTLEEKTEEKAMVQFLERFTDYPFLVKFKNSEYLIGEGEPTFTVNFKKAIPIADLMKSTSLALGEAYMRGDLDIEGNLYEALDHFLGQMGKFSTNESALKKIMFSSTSKKNQEKEVTSHYDIGNDFYKLWLDETMSYSCGYFIHEDDTLYQAQVNKVDYILKKLHLEEGMSLLDIENLRLHYNKTLLHWEKNFRDNIETEKTMFDENFLRMWDLYLSACAATFHNGIIDLHQILMTKGINNNLPMTRWY